MTTISAIELKALLEAGSATALLNVRPSESHGEPGVPGSLHIPYVELKEKALLMIPDKGAPLAVYGMDLMCETSTKAALLLAELGYTQIYNFTAGLKGWQDAGFPTQ